LSEILQVSKLAFNLLLYS